LELWMGITRTLFDPVESLTVSMSNADINAP
jgi:hypothetical protein